MGKNYGVSPEYGVALFLHAARHKQAHPALTQASEGWYSIYLPQRDGRPSWPRCLITTGQGIEPLGQKSNALPLFHSSNISNISCINCNML